MKSLLTQLILIVGFVFSANAFALDPIYTGGFFSNDAIKGYDTVAYFTENKAVKGSSDYSTEYQGANWLFSSQEHLALFVANPEQYTPQYGGYCAYAVSQNQTAPIQPDLFTVHDGKLYLNYSKSVNNKWLKDKAGYIDSANTHWPTLVAE